VPELWDNTKKTRIEETASDIEPKKKWSILQEMGDRHMVMKALMEHAVCGVEDHIISHLTGSDKKRCMEGNNKTL
jgi:hypothetical protein